MNVSSKRTRGLTVARIRIPPGSHHDSSIETL
jgi:hypothetical protein